MPAPFDGPVTLRPARPEDAEVHFRRPASAEIVRMYGGDPNRFEERDMARSRAWVDWLSGQPFGRIVEVAGRPGGHVRLHSVVKEDRKARLAIGLFAEADLGRGIGRRAIGLALDHAFGPMGLHRVDLRVLAYNARAIRCYRASGFVHEGTEREAVFVGGAWHDEWIMGMLAREYR